VRRLRRGGELVEEGKEFGPLGRAHFELDGCDGGDETRGGVADESTSREPSELGELVQWVKRERERASKQNERVLLYDHLEDVCLYLVADLLRVLEPHLPVLGHDTLPQLNGSKLSDLQPCQEE
jgi:hypothetical protein